MFLFVDGFRFFLGNPVVCSSHLEKKEESDGIGLHHFL